MTTYTQIKRLSGNNIGYAENAIATLTETCWWIDASDLDRHDIIFFRSRDNDWVAIPAAYEDEGTEFYTTRGALVSAIAHPDTCARIAVTAAE